MKSLFDNVPRISIEELRGNNKNLIISDLKIQRIDGKFDQMSFHITTENLIKAIHPETSEIEIQNLKGETCAVLDRIDQAYQKRDQNYQNSIGQPQHACYVDDFNEFK